MNFLAPFAFGLLLLLPVIVAMYLLKLRRLEQSVSSVYLWRRMVRDVEANAPWQRLRRNLLLLLQLLFLLALILALARPFTWAKGVGGQAEIVIIDTSASMAASDVSPSRLEEAKAQARRLVSNLSEQARVTVIAAGQGAQVLAASSQDRRQALQAIDGIRPGAGGSDLSAALQLAAAIAARQPDTEISVLSDGRVTLPERLAVKGHISYYPIGLSGENQAISLLTLEPALGRGALTAFAQVANYGEQAARRRLEFYADGALVNAYDLEIPPKGQKAVLAEDLPDGTQSVEARLAGGDALALDDHAWAVYRQRDPAQVTLVTEGNLFLDTALKLFPGLEVKPVTPEEWKNGSLEGIEGIDSQSTGSQSSNLPTFQPASLTIFDSFLPITTSLPAGNLFFIAPPQSSEFFSVTGTLKDPSLRPANAEDPLLANINLAGISVLDAAQVALPDWARPVIVGDTSGGSSPMLFAGEVDGRRVAVLAFDLHRSDLPLQVAFPLLLSNLFGWLAPGSGSQLPSQVTPGSAAAFPTPPDVANITLTRPDGSRLRLAAQGGQVLLSGVDQLGLYQVSYGESQFQFAANLFDPQESDLKPSGTLPLSGSEGGEGATGAQGARREWWRPLALAALALLTAEWLVYQRSTIARLVANLRRNLEGWKVGRSGN